MLLMNNTYTVLMLFIMKFYASFIFDSLGVHEHVCVAQISACVSRVCAREAISPASLCLCEEACVCACKTPDHRSSLHLLWGLSQARAASSVRWRI